MIILAYNDVLSLHLPLGLGTSTSKEAKEYFSDMNRHRIPFRYGGTEDEASILLVRLTWDIVSWLQYNAIYFLDNQKDTIQTDPYTVY